ncbi:MAG: hypothetical protein HY562_06395 [Ignavibacteriales bacterium]|nr:hypothetical protein [Ignavibacteriales bacterium]
MAFQKLRSFLYNYRNAIFSWLAIAVLVLLGLYFNIDEHILGAVVILVGFLGQAFGALIAWIALVPLIGPIIAKVLSLPFIWIINGIGYLASAFAIKRGYTKDVLNHRIITITLLVGITLGYVLGKII